MSFIHEAVLCHTKQGLSAKHCWPESSGIATATPSSVCECVHVPRVVSLYPTEETRACGSVHLHCGPNLPFFTSKALGWHVFFHNGKNVACSASSQRFRSSSQGRDVGALTAQDLAHNLRDVSVCVGGTTLLHFLSFNLEYHELQEYLALLLLTGYTGPTATCRRCVAAVLLQQRKSVASALHFPITVAIVTFLASLCRLDFQKLPGVLSKVLRACVRLVTTILVAALVLSLQQTLEIVTAHVCVDGDIIQLPRRTENCAARGRRRRP